MVNYLFLHLCVSNKECEITDSNEDDDATTEIPLKLTNLTDSELLQLHDWNFNVLTFPSLQDKFRIVRGMFVDT